MRSVAETLVDGGILHVVTGAGREVGVAPARPPDRIAVHDIVTCLIEQGTSLRRAATARPDAPADRVLLDLEAGLRDRWATVTLGDLLEEEEQRVAQDVLRLPVRNRRRDES